MFEPAVKIETIRTKYIIPRAKSEGTRQRRKTKEVSRQSQTMQKRQDIPKQRKNFLPTSREGIKKNMKNRMQRS